MERLLSLPRLPPLILPKELQVREAEVAPRPVLRLENPPDRQLVEAPLVAEVSFDYDGWVVSAGSAEQRRFQPDRARILVRDLAAERAALQTLADLGWRRCSTPRSRCSSCRACR